MSPKLGAQSPTLSSLHGLGVEEMGSRLTIALSEVEKGGVAAMATKLLCLVHMGLLYGLVPTEDHHLPGPQVHCVHRAILLAQLGVGRQRSQGCLGPWDPSPSPKPRPLHLGERGQPAL